MGAIKAVRRLTPEIKRSLRSQRAEHSHFIHHFFRKKGMTVKSVAEECGMSKDAFYRTISGQQNSVAVLQHLRSFGVPEEWLFDPLKYEFTEG